MCDLFLAAFILLLQVLKLNNLLQQKADLCLHLPLVLVLLLLQHSELAVAAL